MSAAAEAHSILEAALRLVPRRPDDNKGSLLGKAAGALRLSYWQAKKIRYGEIKTVDADKLAAMRANLEELKQGAVKRRGALDDIQTRLADLRSQEGSRNPDRDRGGTAPSGGRGDQACGSSDCESGGNAAARPFPHS